MNNVNDAYSFTDKIVLINFFFFLQSDDNSLIKLAFFSWLKEVNKDSVEMV